MKQSILTYYFILSTVVGSLIYSAQKTQVQLPKIVNNYINDFLIIPIVLTVCLYILRYSKHDKMYQIPLLAILYLCVLYSVFFEAILPRFHERYTADSIDVVLYFLSGLMFYFLQKKELVFLEKSSR